VDRNEFIRELMARKYCRSHRLRDPAMRPVSRLTALISCWLLYPVMSRGIHLVIIWYCVRLSFVRSISSKDWWCNSTYSMAAAKSLFRIGHLRIWSALSIIFTQLPYKKEGILYFSILLHSLTLNICSFVRQCNTFTSQTLSRHVSASHGHHQL
jgi:hypothetical protein